MGPSCHCGRTFYHKQANLGFLSRHYMEFLKLNKSMTIAQFKEKVHLELNVNITKHQASKTFMRAKLLIHGSYKNQYRKLWDYCEELLTCNLGKTVHMETSNDEISGKERFLRLYICFEALKRGFKIGCRHVIGVDGCHLRGPHPEILLIAVGIHASDYIYPIAYAVGLGSAIEEVIPRVKHRHCVRHLHNNKKKLHPRQSIKNRFWACARKWELTGLPCSHAIACISLAYGKPEDYMNKCYSRKAYLAGYEHAIAPISGPNAWEALTKEPVLPPKKMRLLGRPKKARRREPDEPRKGSNEL
ncbi:uncharacterized protein LOC113766716 [Coffea eugenioides]|uniref:uncharacterized protein LOC113766716 n=1 Tax=Coffea eugenioides TaxID=49369 RepID=UPI000F614B5E|nr:uncharacterized protein LOC113766716 [Coffea eugenioides]